jgi:ABC-type multidrug transport system fused ATPase/permease subunit
VQALDVSREKDFQIRYLHCASCCITFFVLALLAGSVLLSGDAPSHPYKIPFFLTLSFQLLSSLVVCKAFASIDRRPDIFNPDGKVLEREFTRSLWSRYSYSWSTEIMDLAGSKSIDVAELPAMNAKVRAKDTRDSFKGIGLKPNVSLWLRIFWAFRGQLFYQWVLAFIGCVVDILPQLAMLKILQYLESRQEFAIDPKAWIWVVGLLFGSLLETVLDYRMSWMAWTNLSIPIRSTLTSLLFDKLMRVKDCKEPPAEERKSQGKQVGEDAAKATAASKGEPEKKKAAPAGESNVINMFAVDSNQVGRFGAFCQLYVKFVAKTVVSMVFLWKLIGWESLAIGMVAIAITYPINNIITKRFRKFQKDLMATRDKKTKLISEALLGIRQIKLSGMEQEWTQKINVLREEELTKLWRTLYTNILMQFVASISPILLTASSLATYSYLHADLSPSIAFTALGVFMQLQGVMRMLPMLMVMGINAKVACDRINKFLQSPEKPQNTSFGSSIKFEDVSVSFPSNSFSNQEEREEDGSETPESRFVLRDMNLSFPNSSLSIISGPTGSGKSLILSAILGEADVLAGYITVPPSLPEKQRFNDKATAVDWIIPSAIAYVSQTPWIENATVKENILFGLPFDEIRYNKVIDACALRPDLDMFDDGDLTEVGAQGISLSGGQKWRLTLARALYSRAGILVLDDVLSAVDTHVGKHIYNKALLGELATGRTRILATHHVSLCLPGAEYIVRLSSRGVVEFAGMVQELKKATNGNQILDVGILYFSMDDKSMLTLSVL